MAPFARLQSSASRVGGSPTRPFGRLVGLPLALLAACFILHSSFFIPAALAHAYLERSSPAGNTIVEAPPGRIQLWFTERPELRFSEVIVYTADGEKVPHGPIAIPPDNPRTLYFDLGSVPNGTYTVAWQTLSMDDGHTAAGAFAYAVGLDQPAPTAASIFVPAGRAADVGRPSALAVLGRWLGYAGAAVALGGPAFLLLALWPALRGGRRGPAAALGPGGAFLLGRLQWIGLALAAIGALAGLLGQALSLSGSDSAALRSTQ
jgi:copper transport protein